MAFDVNLIQKQIDVAVIRLITGAYKLKQYAPFDFKKKLNEYEQIIYKNILIIEDMLEQNKGNIKEEQDNILKLMEDIESISLQFVSAINFAKIIKENLEYHYSLKKVVLDAEEPVSKEKFLDFLDGYFEKSFGAYAGVILSKLPFSMEESAYESYLEQAFTQIFRLKDNKTNLNIFNFLKFYFCPFDNIKDENIKHILKETANLNISDLSQKEIKHNYNNIKHIEEEQAKALAYIQIMYECLISIFIIYKYIDNKEQFYHFKKEFKQEFEEIKQSIKDNNFIKCDEYIKLYEVIFLKLTKELEDLIEANLPKKEVKYNSFDELTKLFFEIRGYYIAFLEENALNYFKYNQNKMPYTAYAENVDKDLIKRLTIDFMLYIKSFDFNNKFKNYLKQNFFSIIPCPLKNEFLHAHITYIFKNASERETILFIYKILDIVVKK